MAAASHSAGMNKRCFLMTLQESQRLSLLATPRHEQLYKTWGYVLANKQREIEYVLVKHWGCIIFKSNGRLE